MFKMLNTITAWWHSQQSLEWYTYLGRFWGALPWKMKVIHSVLSSSDVGRKWRLLCSVLHPNTEHRDCLRDIVDVTAARARKNGGQRTADGGSYSDAGLSITPVFSVTCSSEVILICWFAAKEMSIFFNNSVCFPCRSAFLDDFFPVALRHYYAAYFLVPLSCH